MARFVVFTNGTETVDGPKGQNNKMERGGSVVATPIWEPAAPQSPKQRFDSPKVNHQPARARCATPRSPSRARRARLSLRSRSLT